MGRLRRPGAGSEHAAGEDDDDGDGERRALAIASIGARCRRPAPAASARGVSARPHRELVPLSRFPGRGFRSIGGDETVDEFAQRRFVLTTSARNCLLEI
ncbi:hypothetical protein SEVIR_4G221450v4 [Setaria viridis]